jgi:hypothetical protein
MQQDGFWRDGAVSLRTVALNARFRPPKKSQLQLCIPTIVNPFCRVEGEHGCILASRPRGTESLLLDYRES